MASILSIWSVDGTPVAMSSDVRAGDDFIAPSGA
jgi:hypothetical protein